MKHLFTRSFIIMLTLLCCSVVSAKQLYVIGDPFGGWTGPNNTPAEPTAMTLEEDGITNTLTLSLDKTSYWTICDGYDSDWPVFNSTYRYGIQSGDVEVTIGDYPLQKCEGTFKMDAGEYVITVNSETMVMTISGEPYEQPTGDKHYTVAGSPENVFGTEWDPANTANEMQKQDDGTYIFSIEGVELVVGTVKYKVCVNYDWKECYGDPSSGDIDGNALLDIPENGMYNLTFTFDPSTNAVDATAEKVIEKVYFVAGQEALMGVNWDSSYPDNQMAKNDDGTYSLSFSATLTAGETYEFKVVTNGDWNQTSFPHDNFEFTVEEDGDYDITITFDPATEEITITLEKDTTGIGTIQSSKLNVQSNIYNLRGQRVNASTRGILIVNGKKVVVK